MFHQGEFAALAKMLNLGVVLLDNETNLQFASASALVLLDYEDSKALKRKWRGSFEQLKLPDLAALEKNSRPLRHRVKISTPTFQRMLRMEIHALRHGTCDCYLILLKDNESFDAVERQLLIASQIQLQRYVAASLAHDLNAPVNTLRITLELMNRTMATDTSDGGDRGLKWERYHGIFRAELEKLKSIIATIPAPLNFDIDSAPTMFDLGSMIEEIGVVLKHETAAKQIRRNWSLPPHPVAIYGRPSEIRLALLNIAVVFVESINGGGMLSLTMTSNDAWVEIVFSADAAILGGQAVDEFEQVTFTTQKNGVGLFAARLILEAHGGTMRLNLTPGGIGVITLVSIPRHHPVPDLVSKPM